MMCVPRQNQAEGGGVLCLATIVYSINARNIRACSSLVPLCKVLYRRLCNYHADQEGKYADYGPFSIRESRQ